MNDEPAFISVDPIGLSSKVTRDYRTTTIRDIGAMAEHPVRAEIDKDHVLRIVIDRKENRNALNLATLNALRDTFDKFAADPKIKCAVLRGAGEKAFAAGGDLKEFDAFRSEEEASNMVMVGKQALNSVRSFPAPVVAFVNGLALGGGAELCVACDMRFAAASAKVGFIHGKLAITSAWGGSTDLINLVGPSKALQLILRTELMTAADAFSHGVVNAISPEGAVADSELEEFLAPIIEKPAHVLRSTKALTLRWRRVMQQHLAEHETANHIQSWVHDDHWVAVEKVYGGKHK